MERQSTRKLFKLVIALVALFTLALSVFAFGACGGEEHKHEYKSSGTPVAANCGKIGVETFTCSCGDTYQIITPATGSHNWDTKGQYCQTCGLPNFGAEGIDYSKIPDSFTAEDLAAIQKAITDSQTGITTAQEEAHEALGQKIDGLHSVHTFSTDNVKTLTLPGTCNSYAVKFTLSTCDVCKATFLTGIEKDGKLGHTPGEKQVVEEPTCKDLGYWKITCTVCGDVINEGDIYVVPHEKGDKSTTESVAPTCTEPGIDKYECKWCHKVQFEWNETVKALGHAGKPAPKDCTRDEDLSWHCDVCNTNVTEKYTAGTHTFGEPVEVTTNCADNKEGVTVTKTCSVCGFEEVTKKGASGTHVAYTDEETTTIYVLLGEKNATWEQFKKDHPEASDPANLKTTAEDYSADNNVVKYTYYICKTCGKPVQKAAVAECHNFALNTEAESFKGHKVVDGKPAQECLDYTVEYKCLDTNCNASYTEVVKGAEHKLSAADWDEKTGKGQLSAGWAVKLGEDGKPLNATCTAKGTAYRYCTVCCVNDKGEFDSTKAGTKEGNYEEHEISEAPHTISKPEKWQEPTCTVDGWIEGPCATCGETVRETWASEGHVFGAWKRVYGTNGDDACQSAHEAKYCRNCDAVEYKEADSRYDHQWRLEVVTPNTCDKDGWGRDVCDRCGDAGTYHPIPAEHLLSLDVSGMTDKEITALIEKYVRPIWEKTTYDDSDFFWNECLGSWLGNAHSGTLSIEMGVLGNCTNKGGIYHICFRDGCPNGYDIEESKQYNYRDGQCYYGVVTHKVDCQSTEDVEAACQFCGQTKTFTLKPVEHKWAATASKTNLVDDCTEGVYDLFECTVCQQTKKVYHPDSKADHTVPTTDKPVTTYVPFSYAEGGLKAWDEFVEAFEAEHTDIVVPKIANYDKDSDGYKAYHNTIRFTYYVCTVCHQTIMEAVAEKHSFVVGQPGEKEFQFKTDAEGNPIPDCITDYTVTWSCTDTDCQASYNETITHAEHKWKQVASKEPTCTEEGEGYEYCEVCNPEAKKDATDAKGDPTYREGTLAKTEHKWVETDQVLPTCKDAGSIGYKCSVCGTTKSEPIPATGEHEWGEWSEWINDPEHPAHLTKPGKQYRYQECQWGCGERNVETRDYAGNGDHAWLTDADGNITWFLDYAGNCTTPSTWHKVCIVCGMTVSVNGPAPVGHQWGNDVEIPATCTSNGMIYHTCTVCGEQQIVMYTEKLGHFYYKGEGITRETAKNMPADELRQYLNIVGKNESSCLAPDSVTVECVDCGARYAYSFTGDTTGATGHNWILITDTLDDNVVCGDFLNSKVLAYCENCGLVIELTKEMGWTADEDGIVTFDNSKNWGKYLKTVPEELNALLDDNGNLNVKLDKVVKPAAPEAAADAPAEEPEYYTQEELIGLIVDAFKTDKIQLHKFEDKGENRLYVLQGDCKSPTAYVVVCSRCGFDEKNNKVVRADADIEIKGEGDKTFYDYMQEYTRDPANGGVQEAYKKLGYTLISTAKNITVSVDGKDVLKSLKDLYKEYVTADELGLTLEEGEEIHAPGSYYTWYNFAAFNYSNEGHRWLTDNKECVVDPLLTFILEDYLGVAQGAKGFAWDCTSMANQKGFVEPNASNMYGTAYKDPENGKWNTFGDYIAKIGDARLQAFIAKYKDTEWANVSFGEYAEVFAYLNTNPTIDFTIGGDGYRGVSNWCKRSVDTGVCTLPGGFKATIVHNFVYQIAENPSAAERTYFEDQFTYGLDGTKTLPHASVSDWTAEEAKTWSKDLLFVQLLIDNAKTLEGNTSHDLYTYYNSYKTKGLLKYSVIVNGALACNVKNTCLRCGEVGVGGKHQQNLDDPYYGGNCQRGPKCVVCGEPVGQPGKHNLKNVLDYIAALPDQVQVADDAEGNEQFMSKAKIIEEIEKLVNTKVFKAKLPDAKPTDKEVEAEYANVDVKNVATTCWLKGYTPAKATLEVCVGCLEAKLGLLAPEFTTKDIAWHKEGDAKTTTTKYSADEANYKLTWSKAVENQDTMNHVFTLDKDGEAAKQIILTNYDVFGRTEDSLKALKGEDLNKIVKNYFDEKLSTWTWKVANPAAHYEIKVAFDKDGYLVLHYTQTELDRSYCQANVYDMDLCLACAIHFANKKDASGAVLGVVDTSAKNTSDAVGSKTDTFGLRTGVGEPADKHPATDTGRYNDNVEAIKHVYAPAADWTYDPANPSYVEVVCLRCGKFDEEHLGSSVADLLRGHSEGMYYYFATAKELKDNAIDGNLKSAITDADKFFKDASQKEFISKAKDYNGEYSYAATAEQAVTEIKDVATKGGIVEIAEGVKADVNAEAKNATLSIKEDTEIKLGEGATLTIDVTAGKTSGGGNATALIVDKEKSLKIEGGVVDVKIGPAVKDTPAASAIAACGVGSVLEFVNTVVKANGAIQAEDGAKIVVDNSTIIASGSMTVATNHNLASPDVTYEFKNSKILSYGGAGVGLLVNNENVSVTATGSLFYGTLTGAWIRSANEATFTNCIFVTGNAVTSNNDWGSGTACPQAAKAALLVGGAGAGYDDVKEMTLTNCNAVISYEWFSNRSSLRQDSKIAKAEDSLVKFNEETNEFTYTPYTGTEAVGGKKFAVGAYGTHVVNVTFDAASAQNFGLTNEYLVKDTNVFLGGEADGSKITIKIGTQAVTINGLQG